MIERARSGKNLKPGALRVGHAAPLRRTRHLARKIVHAKHRVTKSRHEVPSHHRLLHVYHDVDEFARTFFPVHDTAVNRATALRRLRHMIRQLGYDVVEFDDEKPWGGMYRLSDTQADRFIAEFFPGLTLEEAKLSRPGVRLSPKFLLVEPGHRLSWQYHHRRAERWHFLTAGAYSRSKHDRPPEPQVARAGTIVQFDQGERHRLCALPGKQYTLVAEIWQHTDETTSSNEADIVRLEDDYRRV